MTVARMDAEPYTIAFDQRTTPLVAIDMQRHFVEPGGFGEALGTDATPLQAVIRRVLDAARTRERMIIHTREGHRPDLNATVREANDWGYECVVLADCVGSYLPEFRRVALEIIKAQGGIFGWVSDSGRALNALAEKPCHRSESCARSHSPVR